MSIEAEVFLNGHWSNFEELEESLTLVELSTLANAIYDRKDGDRKFLAAIQGIDLYNNNNDEDDDYAARNDIVNLRGYVAEKDGFGIGMGLGYEVEE